MSTESAHPVAMPPVAMPPVGSVMGPVRREKRSARQHVRTKLPVSVLLDGTTYPASDMSVGGFALVDVETDRALNETAPVTVIIPFTDFECTLEMSAVLVYIDRDRKRVGCAFADITDGQYELLQYLVHAHLAGVLVTLDDLLTVQSEQTIQNMAAEIEAGGGRRPWREWLWLGARYGALALVGLLVAGIGALSVHTALFTVRADVAALTAPRIQAAIPADGVVTFSVAPGEAVAEGAPLVTVRDRDHEEAIVEVSATIARLAAMRDGLAAQLDERRRFFKSYKRLAAEELEEARSLAALARKRFDIAEGEFFRVQQLKDKGFATARQFDTATEAVAVAREAVGQAESAVRQAGVHREIAGRDQYYTGERGEGGEPAEIARTLTVTEAELTAQRSVLAQLEDRNTDQTVLSPCDCTVLSLEANSGTWLKKGSVAVVLTPTDPAQRLIEAQVPIEDAGSLRLHGDVVVALSDGSQTVRGRIIEINRGIADDRIGLSEVLRNAPDKATVLIALDAPVAGLPIGLPAQVSFPLDWDAVLFPVLGGFGVGIASRDTNP